MTLRHIIFSVGMFYLVTWNAACRDLTEEKARRADTLIVAIEQKPKTFHPLYANDAIGFWLSSLVFDSLVVPDRRMEPSPAIAASWKNSDPLTTVFSLPQRKFHDGTELDCQHAAEAVRRYAEPDSAYAGSFSKIAEVTCPTPHELKIRLKTPFSGFLMDLVTARIFPVDPAQAPSRTTFPTNGSGPLRWVAAREKEYRLDRAIPEPPGSERFNAFQFRVITDPQTRLLALKHGDVDLIINALSPVQIEAARSMEGLGVFQSPGITYHYIGVNHTHPVLKIKDIRHALAYAIDREAIIKHKLKGLAHAARGLLNKVSPYFEPNAPIFAYAPEKARALLAKHGYDAKNPLTLELKVSSDAAAVSLALIIKEQMRRVGIHLNVKSLEWPTFFANVSSGQFELHTLRWVGVSEPQAYFDFLHATQIPPNGRNRGKFQNAAFDRLAEEAKEAFRPEDKKRVTSKLQMVFADEVPYVSLWHTDNVAVYRKDHVKEIDVMPNGSFECLLRAKKK